MEGARESIQKANKMDVGRRYPPTLADGEEIKEGVMAVVFGVTSDVNSSFTGRYGGVPSEIGSRR